MTEMCTTERYPVLLNPSRVRRHFPIVLHEFEKAGILDEVVEAGYKNQEGLCFRTPAGGSNKVLAKIPPGKSSSGCIDYGVQLGQPRLAEIIRRRAQHYPNLTIHYDTRFTSLCEEDDFVKVEAASTANAQVQLFSARFVVACDGASSPVRKALGIPFEGYTWEDWRFLAINIRYDFDKHGYPAANHVIDPEDWAVIVRASNEKEGLWRIATGLGPDIPVEEIAQHLPAKLERILPGPRPLKYEVVACNPYWAHERVAKTFRSGRVVLCGDAAHVCSLAQSSAESSTIAGTLLTQEYLMPGEQPSYRAWSNDWSYRRRRPLPSSPSSSQARKPIILAPAIGKIRHSASQRLCFSGTETSR